MVDTKMEEEVTICQEYKGYLKGVKARTKLQLQDDRDNGSLELENRAHKNSMMVYENPIASEGQGMIGGILNGGLDRVDGSDRRERFLKRVRKEVTTGNSIEDVGDKGPHYDTPMTDKVGNDQAVLFSFMNGNRVESTGNDVSTAIGGGQSRRVQRVF